MANLQGTLPTTFYQWPDDATLTLIEGRRLYQSLFASTALRDQSGFWDNIARGIGRAHPSFAPTGRQCRTKWNALKSGYENLKRLFHNPEGYRTHTLTMHDELFHYELSDEFWLSERKYLLFN